jgi:hypothetical protein
LRIKSRLLTLAIAFCLVFSFTALSFAATNVSGHWAQAVIEQSLDKGIVAGMPDGTFQPDKNVTRAEFVTMVNKAFGLEDADLDKTFSDVKDSDWYAEQVAIAAKAGYAAGMPDGTFQPLRQITRAESSVMVCKAAGLAESDEEALSVFKDVENIPAYAKGSISALVSKGLIKGCPDGTFGALAQITRAESLVMSYHASTCGIEEQEQEEPKPDEEVSITDVVENVREIHLDCSDRDGDRQRLASVKDERILAMLKAKLAEAKPVQPPQKWPWEKYALSFVVDHQGQAKETPSYTYLFKGFSATEPGYVEFPDGWYQLSGEFNSVLYSLVEYRNASGKIDPLDESLLKKYGLTPLFHINTLTVKLPESFIHRPGEYPVVLYWAYNNEFNKEIGYNLENYLGQDVTVNIYKVVEPLPEFMKPRQKCGRAVLVHHNGKIIGAWLDAGRHHAFACSLTGHNLEEVTGKSWNQWVAKVIDPDDQNEKRLAALSPESVIEEYCAAIDRGDYRAAYSCESRKMQAGRLFSNMNNNYLYNNDYDNDYFNTIESCRVLSIKGMGKEDAERRLYAVEMDLQVNKEITHGSGPQMRFFSLKQETPATGWRIEEIGTGP